MGCRAIYPVAGRTQRGPAGSTKRHCCQKAGEPRALVGCGSRLRAFSPDPNGLVSALWERTAHAETTRHLTARLPRPPGAHRAGPIPARGRRAGGAAFAPPAAPTPFRCQRVRRRTLRRDADTGALAGTTDTVPANKSAGLPIVLSSPLMAAFTVPPNKNKAEIRRHRIPYSLTRTYRTVRQMLVPSGGSRVLRRELHLQNTCKSLNFYVIWCPAEIYSTLRQALPYSPTNLTVPCYKAYRTLRQGIPYSPTSLTVLLRKTYRTPQQKQSAMYLQNWGNTSAGVLSVLYVFIVKCSYVVWG